MKRIFQIALTLFSLSCAAPGLADCPIPANSSVIQAIDRYHECIEGGAQLATSINAAIEVRQFWRDNYIAAIDHYSEQIGSDEDAPVNLYMKRGLAYLAWGKERQAIRDFEVVNTTMPGYSAAHFYRGSAHLGNRRYAAALEAIETAINLSSGGTHLAPMYLVKAKVELKRRDRESALTSMAAAITSDPTFAPAYFERALLRHKLDDEQLAIEDYSRYIELRPDSAEAYYNRGLVYQDQRVDHLAIRDFNRAIELDPKYNKARASKSMTYLMPLLPVLIVLMLG